MNLTVTKLNEIEARLRKLAADLLGVLPGQAGNSGKFLKTDGSAVSWDTPPAGTSLPDQTGHAGQYLGTDGATADWAAVAGGVGNSFETINCPAGTDPVADSGADTLNLTSGTTALTITGDSATDTVAFAVADVGASSGLMTTTQASKLSGIEAGADVTSTHETSHATVVVDGDFGSDGYLKRSGGAGVYAVQAAPIPTADTAAKCTDATADNTAAHQTSHADVLVDGDFGAYSILAAATAATPAALTVGEQTIVGRKTGGAIAALTGAEALAITGGAAAAAGVTNGNSHDHVGGDGAQIDHGGLGGLSDNDHPQYALATGHVYAVKTADQTKNNDNTYAADTHLQGLSLAANSQYTIEMCLVVQCVTDTPDYKVRIYSSQADWSMMANTGTNENTAATVSSSNYWSRGGISLTGGSNRIGTWFGFINTTTACTIQLQWAQNTATAEDTIIRKGSFILLHKVA